MVYKKTISITTYKMTTPQTHSYSLRPRSRRSMKICDNDDTNTDSDTNSYGSDDDPEYIPVSFAELGRRYRLNHSKQSYDSDEDEKSDEDSSDSEGESDTSMSPRISPNKRRNEQSKWYHKMSPDEKKFIKGLSPSEKTKLYESYGLLKSTDTHSTPLRFKILNLPATVLSDASKRLILQKIEHYQTMTEENTEYAKYTYWMRSLERLPFGQYHTILQNPDTDSIAGILNRTKSQLDSVVYGHTETKQQLLMLMAQWISNPTSKGQCIGIQGPMGIGKTTLIKDGVSKALGIPFGFIALGGANDAAFLEGHGFTYEGATYGRIAEILIKHQTMNPILFFDELDKISDSPKGEEISAILTHLTDPTQNALFTDKYFGSIELDLSRCLMVFSFNDSSKIHPILKDRLSMIYVQGYSIDEKINIAQSYLLPRLFQQYNLCANPPAIVIHPTVLRAVLSYIPEEKGIRQFIQALERIFGWLNMARYIPVAPFQTPIELPFIVDETHLPVFLRKNTDDSDKRPPFSMYS